MTPQAGRSAWHDPWMRWGVLSVSSLTLVAALAGFAWLPSAQGNAGAPGWWATICRAAGVPGQSGGGTPAAAPLAGQRTTAVVLDASMGRTAPVEAAGRGAMFDRNKCAMCHGAAGSRQANAPQLGGQHAEVVIKQLSDFQRGARSNLVMQAMARNLSAREMVDVAAHYASTAAAEAEPPAVSQLSGAASPALVRVGDPMRNIAPCASCHGGIDRKLGAPRLDGMQAGYLAAQLRAFAAGARRNDSHAQMRNMARLLSPNEVAQLADFYARR